MKLKKGIVWFRQDLRLHDNEALTEALNQCDEIIPVYVFDDRIFKGSTKYGFRKTGRHRTRFIIESIADLRHNIRKKGSELIVRLGKPEEIIFDLARKYKSSWIFCNRERTQEEVEVQDNLERKMWTIGQEMRFSRGKMLYYTQDLPWPVTHTPDAFSSFKKDVEKFIPIRKALPVPQSIKPFSFELRAGDIPDLSTYFNTTSTNNNSIIPAYFNGGESKALEHLENYLWKSDHIRHYYEKGNEMLGPHFSSKISAFLSQGCLSPKKVYHEIERYEQERGENKSTYRLKFELLWRDYFRLIGKKYGNYIFQSGGIKQSPRPELIDDVSLFKKWADSQTGIPVIDANMRELLNTGFISNRGRQLVASFLVNDLKVNWLMGAEHFESKLIDYDACSNYGNWNYISGVGTDTHPDRYFNILNQAQRYDPTGVYVRHWVPELADIPEQFIHRPDTLNDKEQKIFGMRLGIDYPQPLINYERWE